MDSGIGSMESIESRLQWSRTVYTLRDFIVQRRDTLPAIVRVAEGYNDDSEGDGAHDVATGSVFFVYSIDVQPRILSQTEDDRYLSFSRSCPLHFHVIHSDGSLSTASTLDQIVDIERNNIGDLRVRMAAPRDGGLGPTDPGYPDIQGEIRVMDLFDEKYLLCHPLGAERFRCTEVVSVASYLPLSVVVANRWKTGTKTDFREFLSDVSTSGYEFQRRFSRQPISSEEVVVFSDLPIADYEVIQPSTQMSRIASFKVFDKKKPKVHHGSTVLDWETGTSPPSSSSSSRPRLPPPRKLSGAWMPAESPPQTDMTSSIARRPLPPVPDVAETGSSLSEELRKIQSNEDSRTRKNPTSKSSKKGFFPFRNRSPRSLPVGAVDEKEDIRPSPGLTTTTKEILGRFSPKFSERKRSKGDKRVCPTPDHLHPPSNSSMEGEEGFQGVRADPVGEEADTSSPEAAPSDVVSIRNEGGTSGVKSKKGVCLSSFDSGSSLDLKVELNETTPGDCSTLKLHPQKEQHTGAAAAAAATSKSGKVKPPVAKKPSRSLVQSRRTSGRNSRDLNDSGLSSSSLSVSGDFLLQVEKFDGSVVESGCTDSESFYDEIHSPRTQKGASSDVDRSSGIYPETPEQNLEWIQLFHHQKIQDRNLTIQSRSMPIIAPDHTSPDSNRTPDCETEELDSSYEEICYQPHRISAASRAPAIDDSGPHPGRPSTLRLHHQGPDSTTCDNDDSISLHEEFAPRGGPPPPLQATKHLWTTIDEVPLDLSSLTVDQVSACLSVLNLGQYVRTFREHQIDGDLLNCLDKEVLVSDFRFRNFEAIKLVKFVRDGWRPRLDNGDTTA